MDMEYPLGPVEYLTFYFPGNHFHGEIIPALTVSLGSVCCPDVWGPGAKLSLARTANPVALASAMGGAGAPTS